jgi:hypothetical protein
MEFYLYDYETKLYNREIEIADPVKQYDPRIPGNAVKVEPPVMEESQVAKWNSTGWDVVDIPDEIVPEPVQPTREEQMNLVIRPTRDAKIRGLQDRVDRYNNQRVGGMDTTDTSEKIGEIYLVMQQLRDFPETCTDPFNPVWPDDNL